jgi:hypothetical protein
MVDFDRRTGTAVDSSELKIVRGWVNAMAQGARKRLRLRLVMARGLTMKILCAASAPI